MTTATDKPNKHLDSLTIKNFRMLEDVEIEKLGHVNLIVGKNNSGKSTVLEALALLASGFEPKIIETVTFNRDIERHNFNKNYTIPHIDIKSFFSRNFNNKFDYKKIIFIGNTELYINFGFEKYYDELNDLESEFKYILDDEDLSICYDSNKKIPHSSDDNAIGEEIDYFVKLSYLNTSFLGINDIAHCWDSIILTDDEDIVIQTLQMIETNIINLAFITVDEERIPYVRLKNIKNRIPLHEMGDGVIRLLQIILKVIHARDGFLLIDEFENGLHYSVQPKVWGLIFELAKRFNIQVFATTHSWDCIESFAQVAKERKDLDGVLFRMGRSVRKSDKGKVIATVYDEDKLYNLTKSNIEVR